MFTSCLQAGTYTLSQSAPSGTLFQGFLCYNITATGAVGPVNVSSVTLASGLSMTCVAVYTVTVSPPLPTLALLSSLPAGYTGPNPNITASANNTNATCVEAPSTALGGNVTLTSPGAGFCGTNGKVLASLSLYPPYAQGFWDPS